MLGKHTIIEDTNIKEGHTSYVFCCAFSPKGSLLASGSFDETLRLWNITTGQCIKARLCNTLFRLLLGQQQLWPAMQSTGPDTALNRVTAKVLLQEIPAHSDPITAIDFDHQGKLLVSASYEGLCRVWDVETGACLKTIHDAEAPPIGHVSFTPNSKFLLTATLDSTLRLWDLAEGKCLKKYKGALWVHVGCGLAH